MSKIKIGDRVSAKPFFGIESIGTVVDIEEIYQPYNILVKFDSWGGGHNGRLRDNLDDRSHYWFSANQLVLMGNADE
ncbi:MAG TPA: hypothetical protein VJZ51_03110 [Bacilli bacterium]|nr:hypothetical protein [Bacilli bacterium]